MMRRSMGGNCKDIWGVWSRWATYESQVCPASCHYLSKQTQYCLHSNVRSVCSSSKSTYVDMNCTGGNCIPIDGGWSAWKTTNSGTCRATCGYGTRLDTLSRKCNNPTPSHEGRECPGESISTTTIICYSGLDCPGQLDGGWSDWLIKEVCSVTCGSGRKDVHMRRYCNNPAPQNNGHPCVGDVHKNTSGVCETNITCPVDGGWSAWKTTNSGACSTTCGYGTRLDTLSRKCNNPTPSHEGRECSGESSSTSTRICYSGLDCPGQLDGGWSDWLIKDICSVTCGSGRKDVHMRRYCNNPAPQNNGHPCVGDVHKNTSGVCETNVTCPVNGDWTLWFIVSIGLCGPDCKKRYTYNRSCTNPRPTAGGKPCEGNTLRTEFRYCCPKVNGAWTRWFIVSVGSCGQNCRQRYIYKRSCTDPRPIARGKPCEGNTLKIESEECCVIVHGSWSSWESQPPIPCPETCERIISFTRNCTKPASFQHGQIAKCKGNSTMNWLESCNDNNCSYTLSITEKFGLESSYLSMVIIGVIAGILGLCLVVISYVNRRLKNEINLNKR